MVFLVLLFTLFMAGVSLKFYLSLDFFTCGSLMYKSLFNISLEVSLMLFMLCFCGLVALNYSTHYFGGFNSKLKKLIILFLVVMAMLSMTKDFMMSLVLWEYLGFVSFLLILYYANFDTLFAANVTLASSRFGDVGFFMMCALFLYSLLETNMMLGMVSCFFLMGSKSAMIPLSSWLLEAMRAPTPVSSLVHSSTLVAAGIWFLKSYSYLFFSYNLYFLSLFSIFTVIISAYSALYLTDVKKMVALSTCKKMAWCIIFFVYGFKMLCLLQLVSHGIAKCLLFMSVGDILSGSQSSQKFKILYSVFNKDKMGSAFICILTLMMAGLPFQGVFFTKHLLMNEISFKKNIIFYFLIFYGVYLSCFYSSRLLFLLLPKHSSMKKWIKKSFFLLSFFILLSSLVKYLLSLSFMESKELKCTFSFFVNILQIFGLFRGFYYSFYTKDKSLFSYFNGQDLVVKKFILFLSKMLKTSYLMSSYRWEVNLSYNIFYLNKKFSNVTVPSVLFIILGLLLLLIFL